jgi:hypothetical protein
MMKLKTNKTLTKRLRRKNQKNKDQIEKNNIWQILIKGLNWKKNKTSIKEPRTKIKKN